MTRGFMPLGVAQPKQSVNLCQKLLVTRGFMPLGVAQKSLEKQGLVYSLVTRGFMPLGVAQVDGVGTFELADE